MPYPPAPAIRETRRMLRRLLLKFLTASASTSFGVLGALISLVHSAVLALPCASAGAACVISCLCPCCINSPYLLHHIPSSHGFPPLVCGKVGFRPNVGRAWGGCGGTQRTGSVRQQQRGIALTTTPVHMRKATHSDAHALLNGLICAKHSLKSADF